MRYPSAKIIALKLLYDKATIISNEILNLVSINSFFNEKVKDLVLKALSGLKSDDNKVDKQVQDDVEKLLYSHRLTELLDCAFENDQEKFNRKRDLETSGRELCYLYGRTWYLKAYVKKVMDKRFSPTQDLLIISYFYKELQQILRAVKVNAYVLKFRKENAYQSYVPSPLLHRRFRIYNSHLFLLQTIRKILEKFIEGNGHIIEKNYPDFLLTADYDVGALVDEATESDIALVRGDFFWRELDAFQPIIIHEILHKITLRDKFRKGKEKLIQKISTVIQTSPISFASNRDMLEKTIDDMIVDAMAYYAVGDSYLLSLVFGGLWGYYYFDTLHGIPEEGKISLKFTPGVINFSSFRERAIVRLKFLISLRKRLKDKKQDGKLTINGADEILKQVVYYINDLFPLENEKGETYNKLSPLTQQSVALISSLCKYTTNLVLNFVSSIHDIPFRKKLKPVGIFDNEVKIFLSNGNDSDRYSIFYNSNFKNCSIELREQEKDTKLDIYLRQNHAKMNGKEINVFNLMWYYIIRHFEKAGKINRDIFASNIPMGRINIIYMLISMYGPILEKLVQRDNNHTIRLGLDELFIVKMRKISDNDNQTKNWFNLYEDRCSSIKGNVNRKNSDEKKLVDKCFFSTGFYDIVFLKGKDKSGKEDELDIYTPLISSRAYVDRHPFIVVDNYSDIEIKHPFSGFILTQLTEQFFEKAKKGQRNSQTLEQLVKPFTNYIGKNGFTLLGFSMGWEDLIFFLNGPLSEIFKSWVLHTEFPDLIKRTETVIAMSFDNSAVKVNVPDKYMVQINLRCENVKQASNSGYDKQASQNNKQDPGDQYKQLLQYLNNNLKDVDKIYRIPGRFDISIKSKEDLDEEGVFYFVKNFLELKIPKNLNIDDYYIRILQFYGKIPQKSQDYDQPETLE